MVALGVERRARRALRQLEYQQLKAERIRGGEAAVIAGMAAESKALRERLERIRPLPSPTRALEVGSGAHGLIFYFDVDEKVGVDPLADHYRELFPAWQGRMKTIAVGGEKLPFPDAAFDVVISDNVVDHAESPRKIVEEMTRVLAPGGLMYSRSISITRSIMPRRRSTPRGARLACRSRSRRSPTIRVHLT